MKLMTGQSMKKAIATGLIGLTALGASAVVPNIAEAQELPTQEVPTQEMPTQEERDARQANRAEHRAERIAVLTDALGVGEDVLQAARDAGQSIADVAADQGVAIETVVDAIVESQTAHIQEHVVAGGLTQAEANERIAGLAERVTERVNATPGEHGDGERGPRGPRGPRGLGIGEEAPAA